MNLSSIGKAFSSKKTPDTYTRLEAKPLKHKKQKYAAVMYRKKADGENVPSLKCLPHVIRFLKHEGAPTNRILKLRTDLQGHPYLSRDKYRQQRASVMGIPVDPGAGQRDATDYFLLLAVEALSLGDLSDDGNAAREQFRRLASNIEVRDTQELRDCLNRLNAAIQQRCSVSEEDDPQTSGSFDSVGEESLQTIQTYTAWNDPHNNAVPSISGETGANGIDLDGSDSDQVMGHRLAGQSDVHSIDTHFHANLDADTVTDVLAGRERSPVVLPAHVVDRMNAIFERFEQSKADDKHQIRLDLDDPATQAPAPTQPKKRWPFGKKN